jgi:hypothetical protein
MNFFLFSQNHRITSVQHAKLNIAQHGDWCSTFNTHMESRSTWNRQMAAAAAVIYSHNSSNSKTKPNRRRRHRRAIISVAVQRVQQVPQVAPRNHYRANSNRTCHHLACVIIHCCHHPNSTQIHLPSCECHCHHCLKVN